MVGGNCKLLATVALLCVLVSAGAASTTNKFSSAGDCAVSVVPTTDVRESREAILPLEVSNSYLAQVAPQILKPPIGFTKPADSLVADTKSLPAVPAAVLLVVTGFLCVTLVNDRKLWLAVLAGLLGAGQTGIQALPHLALRFGHRNHIEQRLDVELAHPSCLMNSYRLRSEIEGTQYIGLLYYLEGIVDAKNSFTADIHPAGLTEFGRYLYDKIFNCQGKRTINTPQFAVISKQNGFLNMPKYPALAAEYFICFCPAFIFNNLPRGPPNPTMRNWFSNLA